MSSGISDVKDNAYSNGIDSKYYKNMHYENF